MFKKDSPTPLYKQLKASLKEDIINGLYKENEQIPTEIEIEQKYEVSRITVRSAVKELVEDGYLVKHPGKGTFVVHPKLEHGFDYAHSFSKNAVNSNQETHSKILKTEIVSKDQIAAQFLKSKDYSYDQYFCISKLRYLDDIPMIVESNYFPLPKMEAVISFDHQKSLFDNLRDNLGISQIRFINGIISVDNPASKIVDYLNISSMTPVIFVRQNALDEKGNLLYFGKQVISSTSYIFKIPEQVVKL